MLIAEHIWIQKNIERCLPSMEQGKPTYGHRNADLLFEH